MISFRKFWYKKQTITVLLVTAHTTTAFCSDVLLTEEKMFFFLNCNFSIKKAFQLQFCKKKLTVARDCSQVLTKEKNAFLQILKSKN